MINVYTEEFSPRLEYSLRLVFETILKSKVAIFDKRDEFLPSKGIKINYSNRDDIDGLKLKPTKLLFENHLQEQYPDLTVWDGLPALFKVEKSFLPFDLFAATFYLVTRYEEYFPGKHDNHNRFMAKKSFAGQNNFLEKPLVNIWAHKLADLLESEDNKKIFTRPKFTFQPTFDIDNAYAYKNKGFIRNFLSALNDIKRGNWSLISKRLAVLNRMIDDPYDNYNFILETVQKHNYKPITFFLLNKKGKRDRSLSYKNSAFRNLIVQMSDAGKVGIHPSYSSNGRNHLLNTEINHLKQITGEEVTLSRQHYLRISMPKTYRNLIAQGIKEDYSMGYPTRPGFRASICTPFIFFDVLNNETTNLVIYPFQVMDVTLRHYRNLNAKDAIAKIEKLMNETYAVGGTFMSLWHNESLSDEGHWAGWRTVFTEMIQMAAKKQND